MAFKGVPSITFGGTTYNADDCLQPGITFTVGNTDLTYVCNGYVKHEPGAETITLSFSIAMDQADTTQIAALMSGSTGTAEYHPYGDTAGNIEHTTTNATITGFNENGGSDNIVIADITMVWDDRTTGAAAS